MPPNNTTPYHNLQLWGDGQEDWEHRTDMEILDAILKRVDSTGNVFGGSGSPQGDPLQAVEAQSITATTDLTAADFSATDATVSNAPTGSSDVARLAEINALDSDITTLDNQKADLSADGTAELTGYASIESDTVRTTTEPAANVKTFGAVGDGTTDDSGAFQSAIDSGANRIYAPEATYNIESELTLGDAHLFGDGMGKSVLRAGTTMTRIAHASVDGGGASDITLDGNASVHECLRLSAPHTFGERVEATDVTQNGTSTMTTACIAAFSALNAQIHQCRATVARAPNSGVSRGILADGSNGGEIGISDCYVDDIQPTDDGDGIVVQNGNPQSRVVDNTVTNASKSAVKINSGAVNTTVSGNVLHTAPPGLSVARLQSSGASFVGNTVNNPDVGGELVRVSDGATNVTIAGNTLEITEATSNCECIRVRDTESNVSITGNALNMNNTGRHGILVDASPNVTITGNTILNTGERGMTLEGPTGCTVTGNNINGAGTHGIYVADTSSRVVITGNAIVSGDTYEDISDTGAVATIGTNAT
jgi:parallel beta-helix repeat protein